MTVVSFNKKKPGRKMKILLRKTDKTVQSFAQKGRVFGPQHTDGTNKMTPGEPLSRSYTRTQWDKQNCI